MEVTFRHIHLGTPALRLLSWVALLTPTEVLHFTLLFTTKLSLYSKIHYLEVCDTVLIKLKNSIFKMVSLVALLSVCVHFKQHGRFLELPLQTWFWSFLLSLEDSPGTSMYISSIVDNAGQQSARKLLLAEFLQTSVQHLKGFKLDTFVELKPCVA